MAKVKRFKLKHHDPFIIDGDNGEHAIPPLEKIAFTDWKDVAALADGKATMEQMLAEYKAFFLKVCPDLEDEQIGDNQWLQLGGAYFEAMGE